jgi:hypothetical protein
VPDKRTSDLPKPTGLPLVIWPVGNSGGTTKQIAHIYAAGTSGSPDTVTYPVASYPPGSLYFVTDSTPPMAVFVNDGTSWVRTDAVGDVSARVYHSAHQSLASGILTMLAFDSERFDTDGFHDPVTNNSRLTIPVTGLYFLWGNVAFAANSTGKRHLLIQVNGSTNIGEHRTLSVSGTAQTRMMASSVYRLTAGDYVELAAYQDSGGALDVQSTGAGHEVSPEFAIARVAP